MRTLCVKQPWADLIASGKKTIELRTWRIKRDTRGGYQWVWLGVGYEPELTQI